MCITRFVKGIWTYFAFNLNKTDETVLHENIYYWFLVFFFYQNGGGFTEYFELIYRENITPLGPKYVLGVNLVIIIVQWFGW